MKNRLLFIILLTLLVFALGNPAAIVPMNWAGFTWMTGTQGSASVAQSGDFVILQSSQGGSVSADSYAEMVADVTGIDEILVILEADAYASSNYGASGGSGTQVSIVGSEGGIITLGETVSVGSSETATISRHIDAQVYKLRDNFDGTWSALESLGVGDIFIAKETKEIKGNPKLRIRVLSSISGVGATQSASSSISAKVYNVVRKESGFAVCKADEVLVGDVCKNLNTILLQSEEAIKESFDEKIARITAELEQKNAGLSAEIEKLKELQADQTRIIALEEELKLSKQRLAEVEAKNREIIAVIEAQEQFREPNIFSKVWSRIISFIKNIFSFLR